MVSDTRQILDVTETFSDEVAFMWPSRFTTMKVIYFVNRYLPLLEIALSVICILFVRTLALWEFSRVVLGILIALATAIVVSCLVIVQRYLKTIQCALRSAESARSECSKYLIVDGCRLVDPTGELLKETGCIDEKCDSLLTLASGKLTGTSAIMANHNLPSLLHTTYRDGNCFYAVILLVSVANLLCMTLAPKQASSLLQLYAIISLTSRVLLNLRAAAARSSSLSLSDFHRTTSIAFEMPDIPLNSGWDGELGVDDWTEPQPESHAAATWANGGTSGTATYAPAPL
ncbi:hypothetical protein ONZ51_g2358 [Trametes cubensis]|uniref:DUF6533 domain-containing protein n=1 Tax=Trametes cubensis TaxID=1111947 RepID=A0AAD7U0D6_9APHY|nr:hypothetical protein ONZ51_g2358 [Trametes cubensis]